MRQRNPLTSFSAARGAGGRLGNLIPAGGRRPWAGNRVVVDARPQKAPRERGIPVFAPLLTRGPGADPVQRLAASEQHM